MAKKDSRIGESLWYIWEGHDYEPYIPDAVVYYTEEHVDLDNEIVRRALASSLQRDGLVSSLGEAFKLIDGSYIVYRNIGVLEEDHIPQVCDEDGRTENDELLNNVVPVTWVEVASF
jgi:hypothetical protein